jgi:predicted amidohydrolase
VRIAAVQHDIVWEDPKANFEHLAPTIAGAAAGGARLVVLTEMFSTGFSMAAERIAEADDGPSTRFLAEQAATNRVWICGSVPTRPATGAKPCNRLVLAAPDGTLTHYDKLHPFSYAGEHEHYAAGDATITVEIEGVRTTPFVCYDLRFADVFWAAAARTDLYVVVANWPEARREHWRVLLRARAIENQAYVVGANRVGDGDGLAYAGDTCIVGPDGEVLGAAARGETVVTADVDPDVVAELRRRFPFLADRRS